MSQILSCKMYTAKLIDDGNNVKRNYIYTLLYRVIYRVILTQNILIYSVSDIIFSRVIV